MQQLDPKSIWLFFLSFIFRWFIFVVIFVVFGLGILSDLEENAFTFEFLRSWLWMVVLAFFLVFFVFSWIWAKLTYRFYRYELREDGFRKELGVIWKKYVTIPYDRIQNVDIYRGIVARILGLSDLHIQTAGASAQMSRYGAWGLSAEGRLPGLSREMAEQLRDELIRRARQTRVTNQGL